MRLLVLNHQRFLHVHTMLLHMVLIVFLLPTVLHADEATGLNIANTELGVKQTSQQTDTVSWPVMPGESIAQLAQNFYPNNPILQQRFISQTLSLSRHLDLNILPTTQFTQPQVLIIPNIKGLTDITRHIKKAEELQPKVEEKLKLSYNINQKNLPKPISSSATSPINIDFKGVDLKKTNIQWPNIDLTPQWQRTKQVFTQYGEYLSLNTHAFFTATQHNAQYMINAVQTKTPNQLLQDYVFRNTVLISILLFLLLMFWIAHRAQARKSKKRLKELSRFYLTQSPQ